MPYQISDLAQATDVTASLASREIELGGLGLGAFRLSLSNLRKALLLGAVSLGFSATDPATVGALSATSGAFSAGLTALSVATTAAFNNYQINMASTGTVITGGFYVGNNSFAGIHLIVGTNHGIGFAVNNGGPSLSIANTGAVTVASSLTVNATASTSPIVAIGITAFSRFSRNEAAFGGALMQFDRSGTVAAWIGMDVSDNLTIQRGADAIVAVRINRTTGAVAVSGGAGTLGIQLTGHQLNADPELNGAGALAVNFVGYNDGTTQFRDVNIYDGKNTLIASFLGASRSVTISNGLTVSAGGATVTGGVAIQTGGLAITAGLFSTADGIKQTGTQVARFENTAATVPAGAANGGVEISAPSANSGQIIAFNRTTVAYAPLLIGGSFVKIDQGPLLVGTLVATGAGAGNIVLPNGASMTSVNAAGTGILPLINGDSSNRTVINANSAALSITNPSTAASASAGGATALPSNPTAYLIIVINGVTSKIPYYAN